MAKPEDTGQAWWQRALRSSITGLIVSVLLNVAVVLCLVVQVPFAKDIERAGIDLGARMRSFLNVDSGLPATQRYIFVDVDEKACEAFVSAPGACRLRNPISSALVTAFVDGAAQAGAGVIIVDTDLSGPADDRAALARALTARNESWIVAPVSGRFRSTDGTLWGDPGEDVIPASAVGKVRLATHTLTSDPATRDGLIRRFDLVTRIDDATGAAPARTLPSAPYLAGLLASSRATGTQAAMARAIDCTYYGGPCDGRTDKTLAANAQNSIPIEYSLPSLALFDSTSEFARSNGFRPAFFQNDFNGLSRGYERFVASKSLDATGRQFRFPAQFEGAVVVIGSSLPSANDLHLTPIGAMTGSEILLNATRTVVEARQVARSAREDRGTLLDTLWEKFMGSVKGTVVMTVAWLGIYAILARRPRTAAGKIASSSLISLIFILGLAASALWEILDSSELLRHSLATGRQVDVLLPIFVLGLEGYAEGMKAINEVVASWVVAAWKLPGDLSKRFGGPANRGTR
jgi:CHASE2 domain-containing sensor protein